jgi:hypothetical protein
VPQLGFPLVAAPSAQLHVAPLRAYTPLRQGAPGLPLHALPSAHGTHAPAPSQNPPLQLVASASGEPSRHTGAPLEQSMVPDRHGLGFPVHEAPCTHDTHAPVASHTWFVPQLVPAGRWVAASWHTGVPLLHERLPFLHAVGFPVHAAPWVHTPQNPALHTSPGPHICPWFAFTVPSAHVGTPEPQRVTPALHTFGFTEQPAPSVQSMHAPLGLHTLLVPHGAPGDLSAGESTHACTPVAHDVTPSLHGVGFVVHAWFAAHDTQAPVASQTRSVPHDEPTAFAASSAHDGVPPAHCWRPSRHGSGFVPHRVPSMQVTQAPLPSHTSFAPQGVPALLSTPSTHEGTPVAQRCAPERHAFVLPVQAAFSAQSMHAPEGVQTRSTPHEVPAARCRAVSAQVAPVGAQLSVPSRHGFGFVPQARPFMQGTHAPDEQMLPLPQSVPSVAGPSSRHSLPASVHAVRPR